MRVCRIVTVVGARPQFIKAATVSRAIAKFNAQNSYLRLEEVLVHTDQHYDENMSKVFFDELDMPRPVVNLRVGSGSHGQQTGIMLQRLENVLMEKRPNWVLIYGDTNSTLAGALAAAKLHIPVAHIEAGLRSHNRLMAEEINRIVADRLSSLLFCPTETAVCNLLREGITTGVHQVGDIMYDSILFNVRLAEQDNTIIQRLGIERKSFYLATIHRAENTDNLDRLDRILSALAQTGRPVVLPMHPRTRKLLGPDFSAICKNVRIIEPVSYFKMLMLEKNSRLILTDSGGVQKEAYWFNVPCITLREETEWTELVQTGWNQVVGTDSSAILSAVAKAEEKLDRALTHDTAQLYGDGHSAEKIVDILGKRVFRSYRAARCHEVGGKEIIAPE